MQPWCLKLDKPHDIAGAQILIEEEFGLCYVRVPTRAPFRLQVYFNGHYWLAHQLDKVGIGYHMTDNAFLSLDAVTRGQAIVERFNIKTLHRRLERWAKGYCPVVRHFPAGYHWSLMQAELLATDVLFHRQAELEPLYDALVRTAVHAVKADTVATFLAAIDNPDAGLRAIDKVAKPAANHGHSCRGFNLLLNDDYAIFLTIARGEWAIRGFCAADLCAHLPDLTRSRSSHLLKRLRLHSLIKKVGHRYEYYLTRLGHRVVATTLAIREFVLLPSLASA
jgi:hypothetical protein